MSLPEADNLDAEFTAANNLLVHLIRQSPKMGMFLPKVCQNLSQPITTSPANGAGLALSMLCTIFNILPPDNDTRYHVFLAILRVIKSTANFESLRPQLRNLDAWLRQWEMDEEEERKLYLAVAEVAQEAEEIKQSYEYLLKALRTTQDDPASDEARQLSLRALQSALSQPDHFDFQDLMKLDCIQQLRKSDPTHFELLEIFSADVLDDFRDFADEHDGWLEQQGLDEAALTKKIRLLTLASMGAAAGPTRELAYADIANELKVPEEEVEDWVIDGVRANLVEGRMAQLDRRFLIQRSTYRVFGENQWREVEARLAHWRSSLAIVLEIVRAEKEKVYAQRASESRDADHKNAGINGAGGGGPGQRRQQQPQIEDRF